MDRVKARDWERKLAGTSVKGWKIDSLIDHGKSAAVFIAFKGKQKVALKIFDDEIIERYGDSAQLARVDRELSLIGKHHPNMVRIFGGGVDKSTNNHFIVMEFLPGPNLKKALPDIPEENIPELVEQLALAAEFLEKQGLVHRDIKPENIILLNEHRRLVLLDFGVLKPVGEVGVTDANGIQSFVGTLQYSSPEFLLRKEEDTVDGWRALTFYQMGGVLHDLIMRRPLFEELANPYARLVNAVQHDTPQIRSATVPAYLVETAKSALAKEPRTRLRLLTWDSFKRPAEKESAVSAKDRVTQRSLRVESERPDQRGPDIKVAELRETGIHLIKLDVRSIRNSNTASLPPLASVTRTHPRSETLAVEFRSSEALGLPYGTCLFIRLEVLDPLAQAICVSACAFQQRPKSEPDAKQFLTVFKGVLPAPGLSTAIEGCIYVAVDQAQQLGQEAAAQALSLGSVAIG